MWEPERFRLQSFGFLSTGATHGGSEAGVWGSCLHVLKLASCAGQQSGSEYGFWCPDPNPC